MGPPALRPGFRDPLTGGWVSARHKMQVPELQRHYSEWEITGRLKFGTSRKRACSHLTRSRLDRGRSEPTGTTRSGYVASSAALIFGLAYL